MPRKRIGDMDKMKRLLAIIPLAALVGAAQAITFVTPAGATSAGGAVDASATFTMGNGFIDIDLANLLTAAQVGNVGQNVSDLFFTINNPNITSGTVGSSSATF